MGKLSTEIIVIKVKGGERALADTNMMLDSVLQAAQNQFPTMKLETITYVGSEAQKPLLMVPTKFAKARAK